MTLPTPPKSQHSKHPLTLQKLVKKGSFLFSTNLISPYPVPKMYIIFSNRLLPSTFLMSNQEPCSVLYCFCHLQDTIGQQLEEYNTWQRAFCLAISGFWEEHYPVCRITPIKCFLWIYAKWSLCDIRFSCFFQTALGLVISYPPYFVLLSHSAL